MRLIRRALCISLCFLLISAADKETTSKEDLHFLKNAIDRIIQQVDPNVHIGIEVISLKNGQKLYEKNPRHMFVPASTQKIFTAASALAILGTDFRFETQLLAMREQKEGVLDGDLYLKGSGDPSLVTEDLQDLVFQLSLAGVKTIKGDLVIDNFEFDNIVQGPGWMWDEGAEYWTSPIDALLVNHSSISVWVEPGQQVGAPARVGIFPEIEGVVIQNTAKTGEKKSDLRVSRRWVTRENLIEVDGTIDLKSKPQNYNIPLEAPAMYTATLFRDLLQQKGIGICGEIRFKKAPENALLLATHRSAPLSELIYPVLKKSDNLYSNCLFKKMGSKLHQAPGTWPKGSQAMRSFLSSQAEIDVENLAIVDGDGESRYNLISPHQMVSFLVWMEDQFLFFPEFLTALPISGVDGTLKNRMDDPVLKGKIRAKGGRMTGISGIAGYAYTKDNEMLAFSIMINGFIKPAEEYKKNLEDQICKQLTQFSRKQH
ncbi:MAG: D-alanyl-D-alanine carboxypeptidase/D-alanyl-D-alanine-endopeptidase [Chlamydiales bacterium]|nr:D-alanyl-D-alanine carboxypeptidase/D-alanyl-D-alanine-endopeptidase [Chlamydiales bacterium]